jgi:Ca2+-binding RTX toxin-like protein
MDPDGTRLTIRCESGYVRRVGRKGGIALLIVGVLMVMPGTAGASMQLVSATEPTAAKAFVALHGLNPSAERDQISVSMSGSDVVISDQVGINSFPGNCRGLDGNTVSCPFSAYDDIALLTGPGNDQVESTLASPQLTLRQIVGPNVSVYVNAVLGPGKDRFSGGNATDAVFGGPGRDRITGGGGSDYLVGNAGNDRVSGSAGVDLMVGGKGNDHCVADRGRDRVAGCELVHLR